MRREIVIKKMQILKNYTFKQLNIIYERYEIKKTKAKIKEVVQ